MFNLSPSVGVSRLKVHEWLVIAITVGILGSIAIITSFYEQKPKTAIDFHEKKLRSGFDILVKGAVQYPGVYHFPKQMQMKAILAIAGVYLNADLRRYHLEGVITKGRVINVPERVLLTIHLQGAVKGNKTITVPKGTKLEDLLSIVELEDNADIEFLQKKRKLLTNEVVDIPALPE